MHREGTAPVLKGVADYGDEEIPKYRDTQPVTSENLDGNRIKFFPTTEEGGEADSNYIQKPFSGDYPYDLVGLGFTFSQFSMESVSNYDIRALANSLAHGRIVLRSDQRREEFLDEHTQQVITFDSLGYDIEGNAGNDGFDERVIWPAQGALRLPSSLQIETNEVFELDVELDDTSAVPSESEYSNGGQGTLELVAVMQVIFKDR